jgi:cytochrome c553
LGSINEGDEVRHTIKKGLVYFAVPAIAIAALAVTASWSRASASTGAGGDAKPVYNSKCASCHGRDGRAKSAHARHEKARDLTSAEWQDGVSDERIYNSISS